MTFNAVDYISILSHIGRVNIATLAERLQTLRENLVKDNKTAMLNLLDQTLRWTSMESTLEEQAAVTMLPYGMIPPTNTVEFFNELDKFMTFLGNPYSGVNFDEKERRFVYPVGLDDRAIHDPQEVMKILTSEIKRVQTSLSSNVGKDNTSKT